LKHATAQYNDNQGAVPMSMHGPEAMSNLHNHANNHGRRNERGSDDYLILSELDPDAVVDASGGEGVPLNLITFGSVREVCPRCRHHLKLVLRQSQVRMAHLLCPECDRCFDAHYANGAPALTI
jgi:hypothetical protein